MSKYELPSFNRIEVAKTLGIYLEQGTTEDTTRVMVDKELAKLFGARLFIGRDWNLIKPVYSLDDIQYLLDIAGVRIEAETLVQDRLQVHPQYNDWYALVKMNDKYKLEYFRDETSRFIEKLKHLRFP